MHEPFTTEDEKLASSQGWGVYYVFDDKAEHWFYKALPHSFTPPTPHTSALFDILVARAKQRDSLAFKAIKLIAQPPTKVI